jgi:hypothetical protein
MATRTTARKRAALDVLSAALEKESKGLLAEIVGGGAR